MVRHRAAILVLGLFVAIVVSSLGSFLFSANVYSKTVPPQLQCVAGPEVKGPHNGWSPYSHCPQGFTGVGIAKLDFLGSHDLPNIHANDTRCEDVGCRVWCYGTACNLQSRCCRVVAQ